ncbi:MAG: RNHCP domain-containing protein [Candidatus Paceibacteria bacterium]
MQTPKFQARVETFVCEHCNQYVEGNGFTNHCPQCLFSKHVDIHPGDRAAECSGLMKPTDVHVKSGTVDKIYQTCETCGHTRANKVTEDDNVNRMIDIMQKS